MINTRGLSTLQEQATVGWSPEVLEIGYERRQRVQYSSNPLHIAGAFDQYAPSVQV